MTRLFDIYMNEMLVAGLHEKRGTRLVFQYDVGYLSQEAVQPIFPCLPIQAEPFGPAISRAVFEGLLTDNEAIRLQMSRIYNTSIEDFWGLISAIGRDCAGALSIVSAGEAPPQAVGTPDDPVEWLTENELAEQLANLKLYPLGPENDRRRRISLAGYQEKMAVRINDFGEIGVPLDGCPSTYILKPERKDYPGISANEHFCMSLARKIGMVVATTKLAIAGNLPYLAIERFDRAFIGHNAQEIHRIHQYDFCQALGLPPYDKYEDNKGPSVKDSLNLLLKSTNSTENILRFIAALCYNIFIGNCDAHGKNYSFLTIPGNINLAPLYDIVCTRAYPDTNRGMAMKIGDAKIIDNVRWRHWQQLASSTGVDFTIIQTLITQTAEKMLAHIPPLLDDFRRQNIPMEQPERIAAFARSQIAHMLDEAP